MTITHCEHPLNWWPLSAKFWDLACQGPADAAFPAREFPFWGTFAAPVLFYNLVKPKPHGIAGFLAAGDCAGLMKKKGLPIVDCRFPIELQASRKLLSFNRQLEIENWKSN